jgi:hypothetical protein
LKGSNEVTFKTLKAGTKMQIDLQPPLAITKVTHGDSQLKFEREGNVYWVSFEKDVPKGVEDKIEVFYEGVPTASKNPPWVGGITWGEMISEITSLTPPARESERAYGGRTKIMDLMSLIAA